MGQELQEFWELLKEGFGQFPVGIWVGAAVAIAVLVVELVMLHKNKLPDRKEMKREQAVAQGNMVRGTRVSLRYRDENDKSSQRRYTAVYEYTLHGKTKRESIVSGSEPPNTITIYYTGNGKTFTEYDLGPGCASLLIYVIPLAAGIGVAYLLGGFT